MKYLVSINKKYQYVKVYNIQKKINESSNPLSQKLSAMVEKFFAKK